MKTTTSLQSIHSHRLSRLHKSGLVEQAVTHRDLWFGLTLQRVGLMAQSCPFLCYPMDCSLPGSSVNGVSQARIQGWVAISFSRGSFQPKAWTQVSCIVVSQSVQSLSRVLLCDSIDCNTPGLPVHHQLPEFTQTHIHWVSDAIQPPHPLLSPSPPAPNLSQHQGLFKWVSSSYQVAKVLEFQHQSFQWIFRTDFP